MLLLQRQYGRNQLLCMKLDH